MARNVASVFLGVLLFLGVLAPGCADRGAKREVEQKIIMHPTLPTTRGVTPGADEGIGVAPVFFQLASPWLSYTFQPNQLTFVACPLWPDWQAPPFVGSLQWKAGYQQSASHNAPPTPGKTLSGGVSFGLKPGPKVPAWKVKCVFVEACRICFSSPSRDDKGRREGEQGTQQALNT